MGRAEPDVRPRSQWAGRMTLAGAVVPCQSRGACREDAEGAAVPPPVTSRSTAFGQEVSVLPTLREACGVFGVYAPEEDVARITFFGLYALQHRGQESAGIATSNSRTIYVKTGMG